MKKFMDENFCLTTKTAEYLYNNYAKNMPIIDYHCHLNPKEIYEDRKFKDITEVWLVEGHYGDHYKWRAIRAMGVSEDYITGNKSSYEKFQKWAEVLPYTIGNPLYHWAHMELKFFFGITDTLNKDNAKEIYDKCNKKLETLTARKMIEMSNVKVLCTTDDPADSLEYHIKLREDDSFKVKVIPAFRPDKAINIEKDEFPSWINKLENRSGLKVTNFISLENALKDRMDFFNSLGCKASDHALDDLVYEDATNEELNEIFKKRMNNEALSKSDIAKYKGNLLLFLGKEYKSRDWAMQYHINALRNASTRMFKELGPDTGFDSVNDKKFAKPLKELLDNLDKENNLPKTILYSLNPNDNEILAAIANCYNEEGIRNKVQFGAAWWFNDQKDGMLAQMKTLANYGFIANFIGMLTDSRSFLSYPRHDYFRRLLCSYFGELIENGEYPNDLDFVGKIVEDISFNNAYKFILGKEYV